MDKIGNLTDIINNDFINNANNNFKFVRILIYNSQDKPIVIVGDNYVRNNFEYGLLVKRYNKAKETYANKGLSIGMVSVEKNPEGEWVTSNVQLKYEKI